MPTSKPKTSSITYWTRRIRDVDLFLDLVGPAEDVGVVLDERPHAEESRDHAATSRSGAGARSRHSAAEGRGTSASASAYTYVDAGQFIGLTAISRVVRPGEEHVLLVVLVVPRDVPQLDVVDLRRDDLVVWPAVGVELAHEPLEPVVDPRALRMEERAGRRVGVEAVEIELLAELAVVAPLRLFDRRGARRARLA